ncbi:hypothetical protein [Pontibacter pamirensis]|uniref:hypothetical protein n=1 Tax=Pontibacter pamirensis TaxID=2562824 RepID=UPI001F3C7DA7|nr:hypothetical protein [Pontibacter pamirensis]
MTPISKRREALGAVYATGKQRHVIKSGETSSKSDLLLLRRGVWLYFFLLLFEGALRKWFLPGLATPLLIVRDPLALWLVLSVWQKGLLPSNIFMAGMITVGVLGMFTAVFVGHGNIFVALYGARIFFIHFPFIFVIGRVFNRADVLKLGKYTLWIAIPMTVLIALQFYSPQSAWVNRGVGGDLSGAGFGGAMGYFRPPATFSFTNGTTLFYGLVACFVFYFWFQLKGINRLVLIVATVALLAAIPLSISRTLFFQVIISLIFSIVAASRDSRYFGRMVLSCLAGFITLAILSQTIFFQTATEAFFARFDSANKQEGGLDGVLFDRYLGGLIGALTNSSEIPFFGYGLGMGTNVGSMLLAGKQVFLIAEEEWARTVGELGPLLGLSVIALRLGLSIKLTQACYYKLNQNNILPWMLLSLGLLTIPQAQWAQPTSLGFSVLIAGLIIASLRVPEQDAP